MVSAEGVAALRTTEALLSSACRITVTSSSARASPCPAAPASLLSHASTFLQLGGPVTLSPKPLPGRLVAHQCSEVVPLPTRSIRILPEISITSTSAVAACFIPSPQAQTLQMFSLPKHLRIHLSLQLLLQKSLSLFRFCLASYKLLLSF